MTKLIESESNPPISTPERSFVIDSRFIDPYKHMNHAGYIVLFEEERKKLGIAKGEIPIQLSISYPQQFKEGDGATIHTIYSSTPDGHTITSTLQKPGGNKPIRQVLRTVQPEASIPTLTGPAQKNTTQRIIDIHGNVEFLDSQEPSVSYTEFAPVFESERIRAVEKSGLTMEELMQQFDIMMFIFQLNASYTNSLHRKTQATIDTKAHLQMGNSAMICQQTLTDSLGQIAVMQQTKFLFVDANGNKKPMPDAILQQFKEAL